MSKSEKIRIKGRELAGRFLVLAQGLVERVAGGVRVSAAAQPVLPAALVPAEGAAPLAQGVRGAAMLPGVRTTPAQRPAAAAEPPGAVVALSNGAARDASTPAVAIVAPAMARPEAGAPAPQPSVATPAPHPQVHAASAPSS